MHRFITTVSSVIVILTLGITQNAASDELLKARFLREAPAGWKHLEAATQDVSANYTETTVTKTASGAGQQLIRKGSVHLRVADRLLLNEINGPKGTTLRCFNPSEVFLIHRDPNAIGWRFVDCCSGKGDCCSPTFTGDKVRSFIGQLNATYSVEPFNLREMLEREDIQLASIGHESHNGNPAVKVAFHWNSSSGNQLRITAVLDPRAHWRIVESVQEGRQTRVVRSMEYFDAPNECFLARLTKTDTAGDQTAEEYKKTTVKFDLPGKCSMSAERFRLAMYGLQKTADRP